MKHLLTIYLPIMIIGSWFSYSCRRAPEKISYDTSSCMPAHHKDKVSTFRAEPIIPGKIIFLGNSLTEMGPWRSLLEDSSVINRGIGGDVSFSILARLDDITVRKPSKLFIMAGINDLSKGIPESVIAGNYLKIIQELRKESPSTELYIQSVLPVNPLISNFPSAYNKSREIQSLNGLLTKLSADQQIKYVNLYPLFIDPWGNLKEEYTTDGLHLGFKGYEVWVSYLKKEKYL